MCYFLLPYKVLQNKSTINLSGGDATGDHLILHLGDFFGKFKRRKRKNSGASTFIIMEIYPASFLEVVHERLCLRESGN